MKRIVIYPKDIQIVTGKSPSGARRELREVRKALGKGDHQYVTLEEYAEHSGIGLQKLEKVVR
ncbi:hypothetical protein [Fulvitalea axinellae]